MPTNMRFDGVLGLGVSLAFGDCLMYTTGGRQRGLTYMIARKCLPIEQDLVLSGRGLIEACH